MIISVSPGASSRCDLSQASWGLFYICCLGGALVSPYRAELKGTHLHCVETRWVVTFLYQTASTYALPGISLSHRPQNLAPLVGPYREKVSSRGKGPEMLAHKVPSSPVLLNLEREFKGEQDPGLLGLDVPCKRGSRKERQRPWEKLVSGEERAGEGDTRGDQGGDAERDY